MSAPYNEYRDLAFKIGLDCCFTEKVWDGCTPEFQENMLDQYKAMLLSKQADDAKRDRYEEVW